MKQLLTIVAAALLSPLSGCGYHAAGAATHIPPGVHTLAVPVFKTEALQYHTELAFTEAVVHEMNTRTSYRIVNSADAPDADAVLQGTVLTESIAPLTYSASNASSNGTGSTTSYLITIAAKVVLTAHDGRVLYRNDNFAFREQFQSSQDVSSFIQEDAPAVHRLARDFAQAMVSDLSNSF